MKRHEIAGSLPAGIKVIAAGLAANITLLAAAGDADGISKYHLVPIDPGLGTAQVTVMDMNRHAQVVGVACDDWNIMGTIYLWSAGTSTPVPSLPGAFYTWPYSVNNVGQVVGQDSLGDLGNPDQGGWFWSPGMSHVTRLRPLHQTDHWVGVNRVDNERRIIGYSGQVSEGLWSVDAVIWASPHASPAQLKCPLGLSSSARGMNSRHTPQIVGFGFVPGTDATSGHALYWESPQATARVLPSLGAEVEVAVAINNNGQIVGFSGPAPGEPTGNGHALMWEKGKIVDLAPGYPYSQVWNVGAINNRGQIVGTALMADGQQHAILWQKQGARIEMVDLNERLIETTSYLMTFGDAINEDGCIIVDAVDPSDPALLNCAFLLVPDVGKAAHH